MDFFKRRAGVEEFFEDGTVSFLSIASIHHGFRVLNTLTMSSVSRCVRNIFKLVSDEIEICSEMSFSFGMQGTQHHWQPM